MRLLTRYILRQLAIGTVITTIVLILAILLTQSMRLVQFIVEGQASPWMFLRLVFLSMPEFLLAILPIGAVAAVLFVYNRLLADGELLVMRSAGVSQISLALPGLLMALVTTAVSFANSLYFLPVTASEFRDIRALVRSNYSAALLQAGDFNPIGDDMTVYIRERDDLGGLHGILLHDARNASRPTTMIAEAGVIRDVDTDAKVVLLDGQRQIFDRQTGRMETLRFDQYTVSLDLIGTTFSRSRQPVEMFIPDLLAPDIDRAEDPAGYRRLVTEGHTRLTVPLLPAAFSILAIGFMLQGGYNRRGLGRRVMAAIGTVVVIEAIYLSIGGAARDEELLLPLLYVVPVASAVGGFVLLSRATPRPGRRRPLAAPAAT